MTSNDDHENFSLDSCDAWEMASAQQRQRAIEREIEICKREIAKREPLPKPKRGFFARLFGRRK
jgi:hypothetical protein